jgi:hypothetical protein
MLPICTPSFKIFFLIRFRVKSGGWRIYYSVIPVRDLIFIIIMYPECLGERSSYRHLGNERSELPLPLDSDP